MTMVGVLVSVLGTILVHFGFSEQCSNEFVQLAPVLFGGILAWLGRVRAGGVTLLGTRSR